MSWLDYDRLGNVMGTSDMTGDQTASYHQDAYGNVLSSMNTGAWAASFSGRHLTTKEYDPDGEMYYFWQRWYEPTIGSFLSRDPIPLVFRDQASISSYSFVRQNSLTFVDADGRNPAFVALPVLGGWCGMWAYVYGLEGLARYPHDNDLRHCWWQCKLASIASSDCAFLAEFFHELFNYTQGQWDDTMADLAAGDWGRYCASPCRRLFQWDWDSCEECCRKGIADGYRKRSPWLKS